VSTLAGASAAIFFGLTMLRAEAQEGPPPATGTPPAGTAPVITSRENVQITVGGNSGALIPIALPNPHGQTGETAEFYATLKRDLEISGWFKVIDAAATLEPASAGLRPGEFDFNDWRPLGAAVLAKTGTTETDGKLRTEVWIYDIGTGEQKNAKAYSAPPAMTRRLAHRIADTIIQTVTGKASFFDTKFAFSGTFTGNKEIYTCDADGEGRTAVTKNGSINLKPRWNAQGTAIAYTSYLKGNPDQYIADFLLGSTRRISFRSGINTGGAFSPNGSLLALTLSPGSDSEIFTIDPVAGREVARLTNSPGIDVSPAWSPDGSQIAFVSERSGGPQIYVMNADGSNAHRVTFQGTHNTDPSWSPKGDRIAFVGRDGGFNVFTVKTDGGGMQRITQNQGDNEDPSWSPDGDYLAFSSTRSGGPHIWIATADGEKQIQITTGKGGYTNPNWSNHLGW
jgi:TolB protein